MSDIRKRTGKKGTTYQVRYADSSSKTGYSYASFRTLKEAKAYSHDSQSWIKKSSPDNKTVYEAVDMWLEICKSEGREGRDPVSPATYRYYSYIAEKMKAYPWAKDLTSLAKPDIVNFRSWLISEHGRYLAAKTLTYFHAVLSEMSMRGFIDSNPASGVSVRKDTRYSEPVIIPTQREIEALLKAADELANSKNLQTAKAWERYRPILYLAVDSGMRPQEYLALAGRNILKTGVQVERAIDRSGELSVPKTQASRRFIEISPETLDMVTYYRDHKAIKNGYDLVFPTSTGEWQSLDNWRKRGFFAASEKAGLVITKNIGGKEVVSPKYTPYSLRHFFASMLIAEKTDIAKIKTLMGHTDISTTYDVYGHLIDRGTDEKGRPNGMIARMKKTHSEEPVDTL
ncbi:tyrosine-type recombinase/integrase [Pseudomonas sp. YQ_5]|uniref:tyrosine-type recombinase/integrase n=1 Tax=Pseudomonas sp. YQ_5 TaxID=3367229 RepID=UPI00370BF2DC